MSPPWWVILTCFDTKAQISPHIYVTHCFTIYIVHTPSAKMCCDPHLCPTAVTEEHSDSHISHVSLFVKLNNFFHSSLSRGVVVVDVCGLMSVLFPPRAVLGTRAHTVAVNKHISVGQTALSSVNQPDKLCACKTNCTDGSLSLLLLFHLHVFWCSRWKGFKYGSFIKMT